MGAVAVEGFFVEFFQVEQGVVGEFGDADEFVELDLQRVGVAVLRVLDQEHHEEGDDRGAGVDDQLPGVAEVENRAADDPGPDNAGGEAETQRLAGEAGGTLGEFAEGTLAHFCLR